MAKKRKKSKKEVLLRCSCKTQKTSKRKDLEGNPQIETEGKHCRCRKVSQKGKEDTKFGKEMKVQTAIIRTQEPTGGFVQ